MSDLFGNPDSAVIEFPPDAFCSLDGCGHENAAHKTGRCDRCLTNQMRGFAANPTHDFKPRMLAGQIVTPSTEAELLAKVKRGE